MTPERQRLADYLLRFGLAIKNIQANTHDEDGFYAYNPITGNLSGQIPWPDGFNYGWFEKLAHVAMIAEISEYGPRAYAKLARLNAEADAEG